MVFQLSVMLFSRYSRHMIYTSEIGSGRPVVFLHGLFGSGENLSVLARRLPAGWGAILADLPSHGRSCHIANMSFAAMADSIAEEVCRPLAEPPVVVGHSLGGKVAMAVALRHPQLIAGIAVLDIAPVTYPDHHTFILKALQRVRDQQPADRKAADAALQQYIPDAMIRGFLMKNYIGDSEIWRLPVDTLLDQYDVLRGWSSGNASPWPFEKPSCCIYGQKSGYVDPAKHGEAFADLFVAIDLIEIPGAEHWLHVSHADAVATKLKNYIDLLA